MLVLQRNTNTRFVIRIFAEWFRWTLWIPGRHCCCAGAGAKYVIPFDHNIRSATGKSSEKEIKVQQLVRDALETPSLPGNRSATSLLRRAGRKFNLLEVGFVLVLEPGDQHGPTCQSLLWSFTYVFCHGGLVHNDYTITGLSNSQYSQLSCDTNVPNVPQGGPLRYEQLSQPPKVNDSIKKEGMKPTIPPVAWHMPRLSSAKHLVDYHIETYCLDYHPWTGNLCEIKA